jgi:hypothetical protein
MLDLLTSLLRRSPAIPDTPDVCPSCDCRLPLEALGRDRYLCHGCARDFAAVRDANGDWQIDTRPLRVIHRQRA